MSMTPIKNSEVAAKTIRGVWPEEKGMIEKNTAINKTATVI